MPYPVSLSVAKPIQPQFSVRQSVGGYSRPMATAGSNPNLRFSGFFSDLDRLDKAMIGFLGLLATSLVGLAGYAGYDAYKDATARTEIKEQYQQASSTAEREQMLLKASRQEDNPILRAWAYEEIFKLPKESNLFKLQRVLQGLRDKNIDIYKKVLNEAGGLSESETLDETLKVPLGKLLQAAPPVASRTVTTYININNVMVPVTSVQYYHDNFSRQYELAEAKLQKLIQEVQAANPSQQRFDHESDGVL